MVVFKKARLYEAIEAADLSAMKTLLEMGANPNYQDSYGASFVSCAIQYGNLDAVRLLVEHGGLIDEKAAGHRGTVLNDAARKGSLEICDYLLQKNPALLGGRNNQGNTALHVAAELGFADLTDFLIAKGADPRQKNFNNRTPLFLAQKENHDETVRALRRHLEPVQQPVAAIPVAPVPVPVVEAGVNTAAPSDWKKLPGERIAEVRMESAIGYRVTEIFNFAARERTTLYQNLETKMETAETRAFDQIGDKSSLERALEELRRRGGTSDIGCISGLDKKKLDVPKPQ